MADSTFFKMPFQIFLQKRSFNFVNQFKSLSFHPDKWNFPPNAHPGQHKDLQETLWPWKSSTSWQENQLRARRGSPRSRRTSPRSKITSLQHATGARRHFYRERTANRQSFLNQMNMLHQFFMNTRDEKSWMTQQYRRPEPKWLPKEVVVDLRSSKSCRSSTMSGMSSNS